MRLEDGRGAAGKTAGPRIWRVCARRESEYFRVAAGVSPREKGGVEGVLIVHAAGDERADERRQLTQRLGCAEERADVWKARGRRRAAAAVLGVLCVR